MNAQHLFNAIFNASLAVMIMTLVAGLGLSLSVRQIVAPLSKFGVLASAAVFNIVLAPLVAIGLCHLFPLSSDARVGIELAAMAAAGPVGMKSAQLTKRADMAMALSFTIVLQLVNIVTAPLWADQIVTGASVNKWSIIKDLLLMVLAPVVIGLVLRARYTEHAEGWKETLEKVSNVALLIAIAVGLAVNWSLFVHAIGTWVLLASAVICLVYVLLGWIAGRVGDAQTAITVSMVSSMRFTPIGLIVIATVLHNDGAYLIPALIFSLVVTVVPIAVALEVGKRTAQGARGTTPASGPARPDAAEPGMKGSVA